MRKILTVLVFLALVAGGWYFYARYRQAQAAEASGNFQIVRAERGDLTATVGATGIVRANQTAVLSWQTSGSVDQVNVSLGDLVAKDEVLATLEKSSLPQTVILAEADLVSAQKALEDLLEPPSELALAQSAQEIASTEEALRDAERYVRNLKSTSPQLDIDQAHSNMVLARNKLEQVQKEFEPYENRPQDDLARATFHSKLVQAQKEYDASVRKLNNLQGTANPIDLAVAEANLSLVEAQLRAAQDNQARLLEGPNADDIAAAEARITAARATLNLQRITAPFDASVTQIQVKSGDQVTTGALAFRLDDLSHLLVDVSVSEVDINRISLGQDVILTFDAIFGKEYLGTVSQVSPVGTSTQGIVDFNVTVELIDPDEHVRPGMTAAVNMVVNELRDVLLVPNRAVRMREGQRVVYVLRNGALEPVRLSLGASSDTASEVVAGELKIGDQIVLNPPTQFEQNGPPFIRR